MEKKLTDDLSSTFTSPEFDEWIKVASAETGGEAPMEKLSWKLADLEFNPLYTSDHLKTNALPPFVLENESRSRAWANVPLVVVNDEQSANTTALEHLKNEAEGILFHLTRNEIDFQKLLQDISWEHCTVSFLGSQLNADLAKIISGNFDGDKLAGAFFSSAHSNDITLIKTGFKMLGVPVSPSTAVDEIAEGLVQATRLIEKFIEKGNTTEEIIQHIAFQLPLGPQLLTEIAKLKAMRQLWYQVVRAYGVKTFRPEEMYLHGYSDKWINPKYQPHGNMLKSTIASIAGIAGGCNAITIVAEEQDNSLMNRIARNTSHILLEESHLGKVNDPFAGAYALEVMTNDIAEAAWKKFQSST